jgi:hypothetical protein
MCLICIGTLCRYPPVLPDWTRSSRLSQKVGGTKNANMLKQSITVSTEILATVFLQLARLYLGIEDHMHWT